MALQLGALRDALIEAGASAEKAEKAAEELATYEGLRIEVRVLTWMVGFNLAMTIAVLWRVFVR